MSEKIAAIHQPNLFPWLGYFDKIAKSDVFVYLDHVVNNPRSAIYPKRVQVLAGGKEHWLTLPLRNKTGELVVPINTMEIDKPQEIGKKHLRTVELNYKKHTFFKEIFPLVELYYSDESNLLAKRNIDFIEQVCVKLELNTERILSSSLDCKQQSTLLLLEIMKKTDAKEYLAGGGASGYQEDELFEKHGLKIKYQGFQHPIYKQTGTTEFIHGLSVIDALMNLGFSGVKDLIGRKR
jgi:hypothetical protein